MLRSSLVSLFGQVDFTEEDVEALLSMSQSREARSGQTLFSRAQLASHLIWLYQGIPLSSPCVF